ncbi:MAG: filamentous hemagglutinin N-terminal domain-containing protein [Nitrospira sp.]
MMTTKSRQGVSVGVILMYVAQLLGVPIVLANPTGPAVVGGNATVSGLGTSHVTINQASQQAIINWQSFNIAPNEVTQFIQPNASAIALNRIFDQNPSQILGSLRANGTVMLLNRNGIVFGPNAQVNVGGLIASSLNITNANFLAGHYLFEGAGVEGAVKNMGFIQGNHDGVYLLAPNVENSGVIKAPGGNIVLAAGAKAYLSNRPDGRGLLAELSAPTGQAVNAKDLIADGGHITLAGRVVNQEGLVQANSVREKNGKIEIYASESLTLKAGSQTLAKGGLDGVSDGGTIHAIADKFAGTATFEKGATLDVSGGSQGGHGGFVELSGSRVNLGGRFVGSARAGYRGGRLLIDPVQELNLTGFTAADFANIAFETPRDASGAFLPDWDLRVTGFFDLNSIQPPAGGGTIRFEAGRDLIFNDLTLWNNPFGLPTRWDIVGVAERSILFTGFTGSTLQTAHGGAINLLARTGNVSLIDSRTGALSTVRTQGGGGISIRAGQDLIASTGFDEQGGPIGLFNIQGINIDGPGSLNLNVGRDFIGGPVNGTPSGPGFVLWNSDLATRPQHTVTVGGRVGETNLTLSPNGLPWSSAELRAQNRPTETESSARYADFALSGGDLTVSAGGNVYLGRVRDAGLVGGMDVEGVLREPQFAPGLENNHVTIISRDGHVLINTNPVDAGRQSTPLEALSALLPASFEARAERGTIQIRSNLKFLPSPTGSVRFFANQDVQGVPKTFLADDSNFEWLFLGTAGLPGGRWVAVDRRTIAEHPEYWQYWGRTPPREADSISHPNIFPDYARVLVDGNIPTIKLLEVSPNSLVGNPALEQVASLVSNNPMAVESAALPAQVSFRAVLGNISKLALDLMSRPFRKEITIEAGNRIEQFNAKIFLPDLGTHTQTVTEHLPLFVDPVTNQPRAITSSDVVLIRAVDPVSNQVTIRPWNGIEAVNQADIVNVVFRDVPVTVTSPNVTATIKARDMVLNTTPAAEGGIQFYGPGTARIIATHDLDLANGRGLNADPRPDRPTERGGLLDIAVGNNLDMVTSAIISRNGAGVSIHGYDETRPYVVGYDNSALYPVQFPDSARGGINLPAAGGRINVGENSLRSQGRQGAPTGVQVINGGSVGQMAREPVVNSDGTVTVNTARDPAAIVIRARGDIDVNKSRIATFGGGDIRITTTEGNINSGSGSKNERVLFTIDTGLDDSQGNPIFAVYEVPGSGIFTFHPDDPRPLAELFPQFNDPQVNALLAEAARQRTFGRDVSQLEATANQLRADRLAAFERDVLSPFIDRLRLGNITLTAETGARAVARQSVPADGSGRIFVSEAGILGRDVNLNGVLVFRGGSVTGRVILPPTAVPQGQTSFGGLGPAGVGGGLPPLSGGGSAAAASSTAAATSSTMKNSEQVQEDASDSSNKQGHSGQTASNKKSEKDEKSQLARSVRVKRGVVIQVDVKPQQGS